MRQTVHPTKHQVWNNNRGTGFPPGPTSDYVGHHLTIKASEYMSWPSGGLPKDWRRLMRRVSSALGMRAAECGTLLIGDLRRSDTNYHDASRLTRIGMFLTLA